MQEVASRSRELLDDLGWTQQEPRSGYDRAVFKVIEQLVREVNELRAQVDEIDAALASETNERIDADNAQRRVVASRTDHLA